MASGAELKSLVGGETDERPDARTPPPEGNQPEPTPRAGDRPTATPPPSHRRGFPERIDQPRRSPAEDRGMRSMESLEARDRTFGAPGSRGPVPNVERDRSGEGGGPAEFSSQFLRGVVNSAESIARGVSPIPGGPSAQEVARRGGFPSTGQEVAERSGGVVAEEDPQTFPGRMGRMSGAATTFAVPAGRAAGAIPRAAGRGGSILERLRRGSQNLVARSGEAFTRRPGRFTAGEGAMGAAAGAGGLVAEREFPDTEAARFVGEFLSPVAVSLTPAGFALRAGMRNRQRIQQRLGESGAERRAADRLERSLTPSQRESAVEGVDAPTTVDEAGQPVLTPAQRAGVDGPLALERAVVESSERLRREADDQIANANRVLQERMRGLGGDQQAATSQLEKGQMDLLDTLNTRLRIAAQRTDERLERLRRGASREDANRIAREEIEKALSDARKQERQLFNMVDQDVPVPTASTQEVFQSWRDELGRAQSGDIPALARSMLNADANDFIGDTTTVRELRSLQQKLRETARQARANNRGTRARIADDVADAITDDLAAAGEQSENLQSAVRFSRALNQRFKRGTLGKLLGRESAGGETVPAGQTLEKSIGGGGPGERDAMDEIRAAMDDPELSARTGSDSGAFNEAAGDFVRRRFLRKAAPDGDFNPKAAQTFLRENEELLSRMPELQREFSEAVQAGNVENIVRKRRQSTTISDPSKSRATLFIQKGPEQTFRDITEMQPQIAGRETQQLLNRVERDPTGQAKAGLKGGYIDFLMNRARQSGRDAQDREFLSGIALRDARNNESVKAVERRLLSDDERKRLDMIVSDMTKLQRRREVGQASEGVIGDQPSRVLETISGITGAAAGRTGAQAANVGATVQIPGILANQMRRLASAGVQDPATRLLRDAVRNESLFRDLLQARIGPNGELPDPAVNRLNAWVAGVVSENERRQDESNQGETTGGASGSELKSLAR